MMTRELVFAKFRERAGWVLSFRFFLVLCSLEPGYLSIAAAQVTFTTFDAPGAGANQNQGTAPVAINPAGAITGYYIDANWGDMAFCGLLMAPSPRSMSQGRTPLMGPAPFPPASIPRARSREPIL